jgi:hypothetical protein
MSFWALAPFSAEKWIPLVAVISSKTNRGEVVAVTSNPVTSRAIKTVGAV